MFCAICGSRLWLKPPVPSGLLNSVVVGVSNEVEYVAYMLRRGATSNVTPTIGLVLSKLARAGIVEAVDEVVVRDLELHLVEAHAHRELHVLREAELVLQVDALARDVLVLVEAQRALARRCRLS